MTNKKLLAVPVIGSMLLMGAIFLPINAAFAEMVEGKVTETQRGGRMIIMGDKSAKISGSRTDVFINAKSDDRGNIKVGMTCSADLKGGSGSEARKISCK